MVREPCDVMFYPEFSRGAETTATGTGTPLHPLAVCSVLGTSTSRAPPGYDGVRFEEVSVGLPAWRRRKPTPVGCGRCCLTRSTRPGTSTFGGHFVITPEMRAQSEQFRDRLLVAPDMTRLIARCCPGGGRTYSDMPVWWRCPRSR